MAETMNFFTRSIEVMAVYSLMITLLVYSVPPSDLNYILELKSSPAYRNLDDVSNQFQSSIQQQKSFGVVDVAALAIYSGNILVDLILNFFGAIPSIATIIMKGILMFMNLSNPIKNAVMAFTGAIVGLIYLIGIIVLLLNIRSGNSGGV